MIRLNFFNIVDLILASFIVGLFFKLGTYGAFFLANEFAKVVLK